MKATLSIKFKEDHSNKDFITSICEALEHADIETIVIVRDHEKWGSVHFNPQDLMRITFEAINASDMHIVELSEKGVGIGIEAGYAHAKGKPVIVIAREGSDISQTLAGIARKVIFYKEPRELASAMLSV